jgi:hypothetical protein
VQVSGPSCRARARDLRGDDISDTEPLLQFFTYTHPELADVSRPFAKLAEEIVGNPERAVGLRKLLEAKDGAVRAKLYKSNTAC